MSINCVLSEEPRLPLTFMESTLVALLLSTHGHHVCTRSVAFMATCETGSVLKWLVCSVCRSPLLKSISLLSSFFTHKIYALPPFFSISFIYFSSCLLLLLLLALNLISSTGS